MIKKVNYILYTFCLLLIIPFHGYSQFTETKEYLKKYKVSPNVRVEIFNKYGKVELITWDKDSVVFEVGLRIEERTLSKLEKKIDEIDIEFTDSKHFLIARTMVNKNKSQLARELSRFKESLLQSDGAVEINYTVWLPKSCDLKLENKYGNIFIDNFQGDAEIALSNGNMKAHKLEGETKLKLSFADATINNLGNALITSNYSELYIKKTTDLRINSKQSTYEIQELLKLEGNTQRDRFRIRIIDLIDAEGSFSSFRINELQDRINLRVNYGDVDVEKINSEFSHIFIDSKGTDISLYFDRASEFNFDITSTKSATHFGSEIDIASEEVLDEKEGKKRITGSFGPQKDSPEKLFINATSGEINLMSD